MLISRALSFRAQISNFFNLLLKNHALGSQQHFERFYNVINYVAKTESKYAELPDYAKEDLVQGIICRICKRGLERISRQTFQCTFCQSKLSSRQLVLGQIEIYRLLFPEEKLTAQKIYDWCGGDLGMSTIYRGLKWYKS